MTFPSDFFKREEFACKCGCGFDTVDAELLEVLTEIRFRFGEPVYINSGCRCEKHNKAVGGKQKTGESAGSQHLYGRAADFVVRNVQPQVVYDFINELYPDDYGMKAYATFTHIDTRTNRGRW